MPEVGVPRYTLFDMIRNRSPEDWRYMSGYVKPEIVFEGRRILGVGSESVVVDHEGEVNKVVAYTYQGYNVAEAHRIFHTHRILKTIFPHNFPRIHAVFAGRSNYLPLAGTIRERVERCNTTEVKYPFKDVTETLDSLPAPIKTDPNDLNLMLDKNGAEKYVDIVRSKWSRNNLVTLVSFMKDSNFAAEEVETVVKSANIILDPSIVIHS